MRLKNRTQAVSLLMLGQRYQDMLPNQLFIGATLRRENATTIHRRVLMIDAGRDREC